MFALGLICGKVSEIAGLAAIAVGFSVGALVIKYGSVHWTWNTAIALSSTFATGYVLHLLIPRREK